MGDNCKQRSQMVLSGHVICPMPVGEVVWVYFPSSFAVGAFLSCVGVFCLAALLASSFLRSLQGLERAKFLGRLKLP
jgi:hypothetical protein